VDFLDASFHLSQIFFSHLQKSVNYYFETYICIWGHAHSKFLEVLVVICIATAFLFFWHCRFSGYAINLPLQVRHTVKEAQESFSFSPSSARDPSENVQRSCSSVLLFNKTFCRIFLSHVLFHLIFTCPDTVVLFCIHTKYVASDVETPTVDL